MTARIAVEELTVRAGPGGPHILDGVSLAVGAGEVVGVVGESGSGKTTLALALLGYARNGATITGGDVLVDGRSVVRASAAEIRQLRGGTVAYVPQDPGTALNPARRIGTQLREVLTMHCPGTRRKEQGRRIGATLREMGLPDDAAFLRRYPHELSGGQQQRVLLTLAFLCEPAAVVLDEPTTALDVTTQARVLATVQEACRRHDTAAILISHDLDVVGTIAHRVVVLYGGRVAEGGHTAELLRSPRHPYTGALVRAVPRLEPDQVLVGIPGRAPRLSERSGGCAFAPRCDRATDVCGTLPGPTLPEPDHVFYCHHPLDGSADAASSRAATSQRRAGPRTLAVAGARAAHGGREVVHGVDLSVRQGECVAVIGESGSGKTTLSQSVGGLHRLSAGAVLLDGRELARDARDRTVADRRAIQYIFQNPFASLNPRKRVRELLAQPAAALGLEPIDAEHWLERVSLDPRLADHRVSQLSGGERQRIAIARGLTTRPAFLVCDEITSALDVSTQATVVELLHELQCEYDLGLLFVTHNLPLVAAIADSVVVMRHGEVVEAGDLRSLVERPQTPYLTDLLASVPRPAYDVPA